MRALLAFARCAAGARAALCALSLVLPAVSQELVRDFDTTPSSEPGSSHPHSFVALPNGDLLLALTTPRFGDELWRSDGTAAGTRMIADLQPGPVGSQILQMTELSPGVFLFTARTVNEGWELWRTDGTSAGTHLVADIRSGPENSVAVHLLRVGGRIVFFADDRVHGTELWSSDGTNAGTQLVLDLVPGPVGMSNGTAAIAALGTRELLFTALVGGGWELWKSDGTAVGTTRITAFGGLPASGPSKLTSLGSLVLFNARGATGPEELWVSDGTVAGTFSLGVPSVTALQVAGGRAYFPGYEAASGTEVWVTDGTRAGTQLVLDLVPGGGIFGGSTPWFVGELRGEVYFFATSPAGRLLFRSNGTATGTFAVSNVGNTGAFYGEDWGTRLGNELWFRITSGVGPYGLFRTDGTLAGTQLVTTLEVGAFAAIGSEVLLSGDDGTRIGKELYLTNGTPAGTRLLLDLVPPPISRASDPVPIAAFRGRALVYAAEAASGHELWLSDGTPAGTRLLADLEPGPGSFAFTGVAAHDRQILILGSGPSSDADPRFSDGTAAGTYQLDLFPPTSGFRAQAPAAFGERFVFAGALPGTGLEPWITDGTQAGTRALGDLAPGSRTSAPEGWFAFGGRMLFRVWIGAGETWLYVTDGSSAGTLPLTRLDAAPNLYPIWAPVLFGDRVWFAAATASEGLELWSTDGTSAGTALAFDLEPGPTSSRPGELAVAGAHLVVKAEIGGATRFVSISGAPLRANQLALRASEMSGPYELEAQRVALLTRAAPSGPVQLWSCDGMDTGTVLVGSVGASQISFASVRPGVERLLYSQFDPALGHELWSTASIPGSAMPVTSFDYERSFPADFVRAGERLLFSADDGIHGRELFSIRYASTGDYVAAHYGSGCTGSGGLVPTLGLRGVPRWSAGAPFFLELSNAAANAPAILIWSQESEPLALPGCTLWVGTPLGSIGALTDTRGSLALPIALGREVVGARFTVQGFVLDPAGTAFGAASATSGLELVIGR